MNVSTELILGAAGTVVTGGGSVVLAWFAKRVVSIDAKMETVEKTMIHMMHKLYGDPNDKTPDGLVARQNANIESVAEIAARVDDMEPRLNHVEQQCIVMHGGIMIRNPSNNP